MLITNLRLTVVGTPWRELVFLELTTDAGLTGVSECRMVNKTDTLVACIRELAPRYVLGSDPFDLERLAWNVQRAEYGRATARVLLGRGQWREGLGSAIPVVVFDSLDSVCLRRYAQRCTPTSLSGLKVLSATF